MKMTEIDFLFDDFMNYCHSKNLSKKTLKSYDQTCKLFFHYLRDYHEITEPQQVRATHIRQYIDYVKNRGKYTVVGREGSQKINYPEKRTDYKKTVSSTTINNYIRNIKVFFNWLKAEGEIRKNPMENISLMKTERKKKPRITEQELKRIIEQFDYTTFHGYRNQILVLLLQDTGMRIGECLSIKDEDIDFKHRAILLKHTKNRQERYVYYSDTMSRKLKQYIKYKDNFKESAFLFPTNRGTELTPHSFESQLKQAGERAGVSVHPHQLRNNFARQFLMNGGDIFTLSKILGHSSVQVTEKAYLDLTSEEIAEKYRKHSPLANWKRL